MAENRNVVTCEECAHGETFGGNRYTCKLEREHRYVRQGNWYCANGVKAKENIKHRTDKRINHQLQPEDFAVKEPAE